MNLRRIQVLRQGLVPPLAQLRSQANYLKIGYPSRPLRARILGYKKKPHMILVRARISKGGALVTRVRSGRRPKNLGRVRSRAICKAKILAQRVARKFRPMNLLNYYMVARDGQHEYYEFILYRDQKGVEPLRNHGWVYR